MEGPFVSEKRPSSMAENALTGILGIVAKNLAKSGINFLTEFLHGAYKAHVLAIFSFEKYYTRVVRRASYNPKFLTIHCCTAWFLVTVVF